MSNARRGRPPKGTGVHSGSRGLDAPETVRVYGSRVLSEENRIRPNDLEDHLATWRPMAREDIDESEPEEAIEQENTGNKRKAPAAELHPNIQWREFQRLFLDEILRHEGLEDFHSAPSCSMCAARFDVAAPTSCRLFRCSECGSFPRCTSCMTKSHQFMPLHDIEEWNGSFWTAASLAEIGFVFQLGHGGFPCPYPDVHTRSMTVVDAPYIHQVRFKYCCCPKSRNVRDLQQLLRHGWYPATVKNPRTCATFRTLRSFRLYNVVGNLNMTDFVASMHRMTKASASGGLGSIPDCNKQMQRMERQWSFLTRLKRSGCGHNTASLDSLPLGVCAVNCWACPHDGRNIPANWKDVSAEYRFLFMLILAMDANFRLKNRIRSNELLDSPVWPGLLLLG
ncbi:CxC2 domain-containing protein [Mycena kentingensis (nom. inval.)]|nr:CxC2 domain-containing protein [Mycena kentingensis (nom. inval.)]